MIFNEMQMHHQQPVSFAVAPCLCGLMAETAEGF